MIDFVTRGEEVLMLRDGKPYYYFAKTDIIEEHCYFLVSIVNSEARKYDDLELNPTEEDQFFELQEFVINLAKNTI